MPLRVFSSYRLRSSLDAADLKAEGAYVLEALLLSAVDLT